MRKAIPVLICTLLLAGCAGGQSNADAVATIVAATMQAVPSPTTEPTPTSLPSTGRVEGSVCYPAGGIPALNVYLHQVGSANPYVLANGENQAAFYAELNPGIYVAYAWLPDFSFGGSYSQAVACGLSVGCTDHSLVEFQVNAGATTSGVAVCDWYGNPGDVPLPPGAQAAPSGVGGEVDPGLIVQASTSGSISGTLSFPSEGLPSMTVVAWDLNDPGSYYYTITAAGSSSYQIPNLPIGLYQVVAYVDGFSGGYSYAVLCGLDASCTDHTLLYVEVFAGQDSFGVNPQDWYAPEGAFPSNPMP